MGDQEQKFFLSLSMDCTLTVKQIWPDGDAPENPTAKDVLEALRETSPNLLGALEEWNLERDMDLMIGRVGTQDKVRW